MTILTKVVITRLIPDTEERLLEELKVREVRAHVIGEIAELKVRLIFLRLGVSLSLSL